MYLLGHQWAQRERTDDDVVTKSIIGEICYLLWLVSSAILIRYYTILSKDWITSKRYPELSNIQKLGTNTENLRDFAKAAAKGTIL